ncbi:MAG TPA: nuclear transport factor 2 family protein [Parvularculaceae bacterium]|nr:nuclear transport factor 2 family protein [Parvularculaceae bacterium]HNS85933.1 nuclear transport factor 2 family protein [Parvularculaceae bacterium]
MNPIARLLTALAVSALAACVKAPVAADEAGLRALDAAYVAAWLNQDAAEQEAAVLALFDRNAVILPGGGSPPEDGIGNLRNFWFPEGAAPTFVTHFEHDIADVDIAGGLGVVSGRYTLAFTYENQSMAQAGNYMIVAKNDAKGWRIVRMIWNDQPLTEV